MAEKRQLREDQIARDRTGKVIAWPKSEWIRGEGMVEYQTPADTTDGFIPEPEDDTLAAAESWRNLVLAFAEKAYIAMPDHAERIGKAVEIVLAGHVTPQPAGKDFLVQSQANPKVKYEVNGACVCKDSTQAGEGWCKHKLAVALWKRAHAAMDNRRDPGAIAPGQPSGEPVSYKIYGMAAGAKVPVERENTTPEATAMHPDLEAAIIDRYTTNIQGTPAIRYAGLLLVAKKRGLVSLDAQWTENTPELSLAVATATFSDGATFTESGDATPGNVTGKVKPHFRRMALTRAKARALRDALGIDMVALEELGE